MSYKVEKNSDGRWAVVPSDEPEDKERGIYYSKRKAEKRADLHNKIDAIAEAEWGRENQRGLDI